MMFLQAHMINVQHFTIRLPLNGIITESLGYNVLLCNGALNIK